MSSLPTNHQELCKLCDELERRVSRFSVVEQELINTRNSLDRELGRFKAIQSHSKMALAASSIEEFAEITAESVVEIFEVECAAVFAYDGVARVLRLVGAAGCDAAQCIAEIPLGWVQEHGFDGSTSVDAIIESPAAHAWDPCDFGQLVAAPFYDPARALGGVVLGANTRRNLPFYGPLSREIIPSFAVLAQQVGALLYNRLARQSLEETVRARTAELREAYEEQKRAEERLRASQRMEAVGRLAGGIAHDFNNILVVISSYTIFALEAFCEGDPRRNDLLEVAKAADRAAALVKQLLAFGRKQILQPEALDLGRVVDGMLNMLRVLIGEDIDLVTDLGAGLWNVSADRGQLEQVIMNLVVNARDAMPRGGRLSIATRNGEPGQGLAGQPHVILAVSDTGVGMNEETRARIFEPFFTTKSPGKGTGLGLSTVFGIVSQSGGVITVSSEPGSGSTFTILLPCATEEAVAQRAPRPQTPPHGTETVLIVEDEERVRDVAVRTLTAAGYTVLTASNGVEGLRAYEAHAGPIHLVLTDVVMPVMGGRELAERLSRLHPDIKVLYVSGYTDDAIAHHGVLDPGVHLIHKPFSAPELTRKVREVLGG